MTDQEKNRLRVECHCHTNASMDSLVPFEKYLDQCKKIGIDKIAITDHNAIDAALSAKAMAPEKIIIGEEVQTTRGEIIGYFLSEWIHPGLDPLETIKRMRDQGGVISIPHPFDPIRGRDWKAGDLEALAPYIDAVETFNARCLSNRANLQAAAFAMKHNLLMTVGSDAHTINELGSATLLMPNFNDAETFKAGLIEAKKMTGLSPFYVHFFSNYAKLIKWIQR